MTGLAINSTARPSTGLWPDTDAGGLWDYLKSGQTRPLEGDVLKHIEHVWGMIGHPFIALHVAGLYATAGDQAGLQRCAEAISEAPDGPDRDVSLALVSALGDLGAGHAQRAVKTLATISPGARVGIGGSNVERILVDLIEMRCRELVAH